MAEVDRIREAYLRRDEGAGAPVASPWAQAGYRFYMQELEWRLLDALTGVALVGAAVCEVGCGTGYYLHRLREYGASRAAGIDLMEHRVAAARERYPALDLVAGDAAALPWGDGEFDVVTQFTCLSSVLDADLRRRIAREMWRVCRPGGVLVSYDMRPTPAPIRALGRLYAWRAGEQAVSGTPTAPVTAEELRAAWPGRQRAQVVSLNLELCSVARAGRPLARALAALPFLRTHLLVITRKPG